MNIGIILYSFSGNTLSVAERLKETLSAAGHAVNLEQIATVGPGTLAAESGELKTKPAIDVYDGLVFGTPVRGGTPSLPMVNYLEQIPSLEGKRVTLLVTGFFPVAGWGREQTIAQLREICESKGATVCDSASVGWFSLGRKRQISAAVDRLIACFSSEGG
jgi:flavodoxin